MNGLVYPRDRIEAVRHDAVLPPSYRICPRRYLTSPLGTMSADSRFCAKDDDYTILYASSDFATALIETVVRDRFARRRRREIGLKEIDERAWILIATEPGMRLTLLDLRRDGCERIGAPTDTVGARNHAAGRAFGGAIHAEHQDVDGLLYASRLTGEDVYAIFDRGIERLETRASGMLRDHHELPDVLKKRGISLIVEQ